jgi:hypothetical protein
MAADVHTCHADCPCHHGGEPRQDFLPNEGAVLLMLQLGIPASAVAVMAADAKRRREADRG